MVVLVGQVIVGDERGVLDESAQVGAGACKTVKDMHTAVPETLAEFPLQSPLDHVELGVHHLHGRVDDTQLVGGVLERRGEEVVVELLDEVLLGRVALHLGGDDAHLGVEVCELGAVQRRLEARVVEGRQGTLDARHDGVALAHLVLVEQGVEDRARHLVLGQHVDSVVRLVVGVQGVAEAGKELAEGVRGPAGRGHEGADLFGPGPGDGPDVAAPLAPIDLGTALANNLSADGTSHLLKRLVVVAKDELGLSRVALIMASAWLAVLIMGILANRMSAMRDILGLVET